MKIQTDKGSFIEVESYLGNGDVEVTCTLCSVDTELYPASFITSLQKLKDGKYPCGCARKRNLSNKQKLILINRGLSSKNQVLKVIPTVNLVKRFKLEVQCINCGKETRPTVERCINGLASCTKCAGIDRGLSRRLPIDEIFSRSLISESLVEGSYLARVSLNKYLVICPVCSYDSYVKSGKCTGVFITNRKSLLSGCKSCRCAPYYRRGIKEMEEDILSNMHEELTLLPLSVGLNTKSSVKVICNTHGVIEKTINSLLQGRGCQHCCSNGGQKYLYINLLYDVNDYPMAIKYGISSNPTNRLRFTQRASKLTIRNLGIWEAVSPEICRKIERLVKERFPSSLVSKFDMEDGYSETTEIANLEEVISIYEHNGAYRLN
ncbi:hypothetical protein VP249E411_P0061 [Vibrio phage 249E41-1]|nr:hypothetical protein VP249E411_P0061 [Vibrio phage 249E41-1]CAH9012714.1 hypothetical protein VP277E431_P0048 [Vibrio phage 277E43-1]